MKKSPKAAPDVPAPKADAKKPRVVLFELRDVPVARALSSIIGLDKAQESIPFNVRDASDAAEASWKSMPHIDTPDLDVSKPLAQTLLAVLDALVQPFVHPELLGAVSTCRSGFHSGATLAQKQAQLTAAGFDVRLYAEFLATRPGREPDDAPLGRAEAKLRACFAAPGDIDAIMAFLRGKTGEVPIKIVKEAKRIDPTPLKYICIHALGGEVERWNTAVSGRLLDLWIAGRSPNEALELDDGGGTPENGLDRSSLLAAMLTERGVRPAITILSGSLNWRSNAFFNASKMPDFESILEDARSIDERATQDYQRILPIVFRRLFHVGKALGGAPALCDLAGKNLASPRIPDGAITSSGLSTALESFGAGVAPHIGRSHLERANAPEYGWNIVGIAATLVELAPTEHAATPRCASEIWLRSVGPLITAASENDKPLSKGLDKTVAWNRLLDTLEADPKDTFRYRTALGKTFRKLEKPPPEVADRIRALRAAKASELGPIDALLARAIGAKRKAPYDDSALADLPAELQTAWRKVRKQSFEAGVHLPAGANEAELAAFEKLLGRPLSEDFRSFYRLHDGGGNEQLLSLKDCVAAWKSFIEMLDAGDAPEAPGETGPKDEVKSEWFSRGWVPFATDNAGNYSCVDLDPGPGGRIGQVVDFDHEADERRVLAPSFAKFVLQVEW